MPVASMKELLEAGVHFGHQTRRWNPKMKEYIYGERNGIYILNLMKTTLMLDEAYEFIKQYAAKGKNIVFVGTKKQASEIMAQEAKRCGSYYINRRWLGGTLTNFETIRARIKKLVEIEEMKENGHFERLPKKEVASMTRQLTRLSKSLGGIKDMRGMPDLLFVVDQKREINAIREARKINIPIVCIVDTNCDPDGIDFVIPANDDAIRSIRLIASKVSEAVLEGKALRESGATFSSADVVYEEPAAESHQVDYSDDNEEEAYNESDDVKDDEENQDENVNESESLQMQT